MQPQLEEETMCRAAWFDVAVFFLFKVNATMELSVAVFAFDILAQEWGFREASETTATSN